MTGQLSEAERERARAISAQVDMLYRYADYAKRTIDVLELTQYLNEIFEDHFPLPEGSADFVSLPCICGACGEDWPCRPMRSHAAMARILTSHREAMRGGRI